MRDHIELCLFPNGLLCHNALAVVWGVWVLIFPFFGEADLEDYVPVGLASAKRIGELLTLSVEVGFSVSDGSALLSYVLEFIPKMNWATFTSLRFFSVDYYLDELLLCPMGALRECLRRTRPLWEDCPRLFVSLKEPSWPLANSTISACIWNHYIASLQFLKVNAH